MRMCRLCTSTIATPVMASNSGSRITQHGSSAACVDIPKNRTIPQGDGFSDCDFFTLAPLIGQDLKLQAPAAQTQRKPVVAGVKNEGHLGADGGDPRDGELQTAIKPQTLLRQGADEVFGQSG